MRQATFEPVRWNSGGRRRRIALLAAVFLPCLVWSWTPAMAQSTDFRAAGERFTLPQTIDYIRGKLASSDCPDARHRYDREGPFQAVLNDRGDVVLTHNKTCLNDQPCAIREEFNVRDLDDGDNGIANTGTGLWFTCARSAYCYKRTTSGRRKSLNTSAICTKWSEPLAGAFLHYRKLVGGGRSSGEPF